MISQSYDKLLHLLTRHTNLNVPYSNYITGSTFPTQNTELLNTEVTIKYRNHYKNDNELLDVPATIKDFDGTIISSRPSDDDEFYKGSIGPETYDQDDIYTEKFRVVRADSVEPYRLIAISKDYKVIVVNSSKPTDTGYEFNDIISEYATQMNEFLNIEVSAQYPGEVDELKAITFRVDESEPCYSIMMEYLGSTGVVRFTLGDEHFSVLRDYADLSGERDYDGETSTEGTNPVDVDGYLADHSSIVTIFTDVNAGNANNWNTLYKDAVTDYNIASFRKNALEGKTIYGTV